MAPKKTKPNPKSKPLDAKVRKSANPTKAENDFEAETLKRLRLVCLDWPETSEIKSWGHPNFKAGSKTFAVLETYKGILSIAIKVGSARQKTLLRDGRRFYETPYIGKKGWISLKVREETLEDWSSVRALLLESYRNVALQRMLDALTE